MSSICFSMARSGSPKPPRRQAIVQPATSSCSRSAPGRLDGRRVVINGRRWRATDPAVPERRRAELPVASQPGGARYGARTGRRRSRQHVLVFTPSRSPSVNEAPPGGSSRIRSERLGERPGTGAPRRCLTRDEPTRPRHSPTARNHGSIRFARWNAQRHLAVVTM